MTTTPQLEEQNEYRDRNISSNPKIRQRKKTLEHLLNSVLRAIRNHDISKLGTPDIAKEANMTKAAIYWYFTSKDVLINEAIKKLLNEISKASEQIYNEPGNNKVIKLLDYLDSYPEFSEIQRFILSSEVRNINSHYHILFNQYANLINTIDQTIFAGNESLKNRYHNFNFFISALCSEALLERKGILSTYLALVENESKPTASTIDETAEK